MIWLTLFLGLTLSGARIVMLSADSDPALHRRLGEWILRNHAIARRNDNLLPYISRAPPMAMEWLGSEVLFAVAARLWWNWNGMRRIAGRNAHRHLFLAASMPASCSRKVATPSSQRVWPCSWRCLALARCHWLARPHVVVYPSIDVGRFAWQLRWFQQDVVSARQLFLAPSPALMVLWANLHGGFAVGLVLLAMYAIGTGLTTWHRHEQWDKTRSLILLLLLCMAISNRLDISYFLAFLRLREISTATTGWLSEPPVNAGFFAARQYCWPPCSWSPALNGTPPMCC